MNTDPNIISQCNRRRFLEDSARGAAGVAVGVMQLGAASPLHELQIGVIGLGQQGQLLSNELVQLPGVHIAAICDVDVRAIAQAQASLSGLQSTAPLAITDHEQLLNRRDLDAVVIATPDHWHARMTIDACLAGKDVYLEQPVAHSIADGDAICKIATQTKRIVQTGLPQRSGAHYQSAVELIQRGEIGKVQLAKAWAVHRRKSIGKCATTTVPRGVDYERWLGPAPLRKFQANRFHQDWNWFWEYGSGELGTWGVQLLDVARWGLDLDLPQRVIAQGSNRYFKDDRETPDTMQVTFRYPNIDLIWEHRQWCSHGIENRMAATAFYGDRGTLIVDRSGWKVYDTRNQLYADATEIKQSHLKNFINCILTRQSPNADVRIGNTSMVLCHLGNFAYQHGVEIDVPTVLEQLTSKEKTPELLQASHRTPWQLPEIS